jgi:N-acetylglucosamine-6-phosphate deacetylase
VIVEVATHDGEVAVELLAPGFVDLQVNGIADIDVASAAGSEWDRLDALLVARGVTTWCPTLVTMPLDDYASPLDRIDAAMSRSDSRPSIAGVHLEGPFLGGAPGAHRRDQIIDVDLDWLAALPGHIAMMTLGAEQPLVAEAVTLLRHRGVLVSIGHTTADDSQLDLAKAHGAAMVTHLFNGMSGLHHRRPGVAAWVLNDPTIAASVIADGIHVDPRMLRLAFTMLGADRAVLVTDAVAWRAGTVGPLGIEMRDGAPRLPDGTLAGSALTMDAAVRNCVAAGVELGVVLRAASTNPARLLGLTDRSEVSLGQRADLVALSSSCAVDAVWIAGEPALG